MFFPSSSFLLFLKIEMENENTKHGKRFQSYIVVKLKFCKKIE